MTVLALRALGLGDLLTALPALRGLARLGPVTLAAPAVLGPLARLAGVAGLLPTGPLQPVAADRPELAVNLHGRGPESTRLLLDTRPGQLLAFAHPLVGQTAGMPAWRRDEHEVTRWCRLVAPLVPTDPADLQLPVPDVDPLTRGAVLVHPGAAAPSRRWPARRWADVARRLPGRVLITGSPDELDLATEVAALAGLPSDAVVAGRTDLLGLAALVGSARLLLCGDTGVAHLATALGTPSVLLFGPTSPALWGPPADRPQHRVLWSGRSGDPLAHAPDPGLLALTPADVLAAVG